MHLGDLGNYLFVVCLVPVKCEKISITFVIDF